MPKTSHSTLNSGGRKQNEFQIVLISCCFFYHNFNRMKVIFIVTNIILTFRINVNIFILKIKSYKRCKQQRVRVSITLISILYDTSQQNEQIHIGDNCKNSKDIYYKPNKGNVNSTTTLYFVGCVRINLLFNSVDLLTLVCNEGSLNKSHNILVSGNREYGSYKVFDYRNPNITIICYAIK